MFVSTLWFCNILSALIKSQWLSGDSGPLLDSVLKSPIHRVFGVILSYEDDRDWEWDSEGVKILYNTRHPGDYFSIFVSLNWFLILFLFFFFFFCLISAFWSTQSSLKIRFLLFLRALCSFNSDFVVVPLLSHPLRASRSPWSEQIGSRWDCVTQGDTLLPILSHHFFSLSPADTHTHRHTRLTVTRVTFIDVLSKYSHSITQSQYECCLHTHNTSRYIHQRTTLQQWAARGRNMIIEPRVSLH